jgi:hypothetical protein
MPKLMAVLGVCLSLHEVADVAHPSPGPTGSERHTGSPYHQQYGNLWGCTCVGAHLQQDNTTVPHILRLDSVLI